MYFGTKLGVIGHEEIYVAVAVVVGKGRARTHRGVD